MNKNDNNKYAILGGGSEKNMKDNSQILIFTKNKPNKLSELNNIKDKIHKYNLTNDFSKSNISESSYTERNIYNYSINENLNIEKNRKGIKNKKYINYRKKNKIYNNFYNQNKYNKSKEFIRKN